MKPSEFKNFISVERYDAKTAENYRNYYVTEKRIIFKLLKISILNFDGTNLRLECVKISHPYLLSFRRNKRHRALRSGRPGRTGSSF